MKTGSVLTVALCAVCLTCSPAVADLKDGLVAYYQFDGDLTDASGMGHDAQPAGNGSATFVEGFLGQAVDTGEFGIDCGTWDPSDESTDAVSGSCWAFWRGLEGAAANWQGILAKRSGWGAGITRWHLESWSQQSTVGLANFPNGGSGSFTLLQDEWQHIAFSFDGTEAALYHNGAQAGGGAWALGPDKDANLTIGMVQAPNSNRFNGVIDEVAFWSRGLSADEILSLYNDGQGLLITGPQRKATGPTPESTATDVRRDVSLSWTASDFAATHDVYFGTRWEDVNSASAAVPLGVLVSQGQESLTYVPGRLDFEETYYWRVDEVNSPPDSTVIKGDVWSLTAEPFSIPIDNVTATASSTFGASTPENTINGSGLVGDLHSAAAADMWISAGIPASIEYAFDRVYRLHELWVWNSNQLIESFVGFGAKDVVVEHSLDGENWTVLAGVGPLAQAPGTSGYAHNNTIDLGAAAAQHVRITINSVQGIAPQASLSEVRFYAIPVYARVPQPAQGETANGIDALLQWRPGREAANHDVVLSRNMSTVADGSAVIGTTSEDQFPTGSLNYGTEYFWRIDEVNESEDPARFAGDIWRFLTPEYLVVDDFEMYKDEEFLEIWSFWLDGFDDDTNGSIVGNGNAAETDVVYEGGQSVPLHYDNSAAAISEITRTFDPPLDWAAGNPAVLSLQIRGNAPDFVEAADGTIVVGAAGADIWNTQDDFRFVYKALNGDGSITAKIESLDVVHDWTKAGVMIRNSTAPESPFAFVFSTGANGTRYQYRLENFVGAAADDSKMDGIQQTLPPAPVWLRVERLGNQFNGYYATDETGTNWVAMGDNPVTINMSSAAFIGLAVTSHDTQTTTAAIFSNVTTTGGVSGAWTAEAIGGNHPSNDPAPMYVRVTDSSGREQVISHADPSVSTETQWDAWAISLADLAGIDLGSIASVTVGVGQPGGAPDAAKGTVFIDLLQVGTPRSE